MRLFLWLVLGYIIWKVIQVVMRGMSNPRPRGGVFTNQPPPQQEPPKKFTDIEDADFEDIPPEGKK